MSRSAKNELFPSVAPKENWSRCNFTIFGYSKGRAAGKLSKAKNRQKGGKSKLGTLTGAVKSKGLDISLAPVDLSPIPRTGQGTARYMGVSPAWGKQEDSGMKRWRAQLKRNGMRVYDEYFHSEIDAGIAFARALYSWDSLVAREQECDMEKISDSEDSNKVAPITVGKRHGIQEDNENASTRKERRKMESIYVDHTISKVDTSNRTDEWAIQRSKSVRRYTLDISTFSEQTCSQLEALLAVSPSQQQRRQRQRRRRREWDFDARRNFACDWQQSWIRRLGSSPFVAGLIKDTSCEEDKSGATPHVLTATSPSNSTRKTGQTAFVMEGASN